MSAREQVNSLKHNSNEHNWCSTRADEYPMVLFRNDGVRCSSHLSGASFH